MQDYWGVQVQRVPPPSSVPPVRVERRCATCGYGAYLSARGDRALVPDLPEHDLAGTASPCASRS